MAFILIIKTGETIPAVADVYGDFEDWIIAATGLPVSRFQTVCVQNGENLPNLQQVQSVIITGSPAMVTDDQEWIRQSEKFLQSAVNNNVPVLGICFGHQLLAQALGGRVAFHPQGREIGTTQVSLCGAAAGDSLFGHLPEIFPVHVTHMQSVLTLPAEAEILAGNDFDPHQGVRYAKQAWGVQFHPEFDAAIMAAYIRERYTHIRSEGLDPDYLLEAVSEATAARGLLTRFADLYG